MKKTIKLILLAAIVFQSCQKKEVVELKMDITIPKTTYKVNEEVKFQISGNPDHLTFYSGEEGYKYEYKERTVAESEAITLTFATNRRYGSDAQQPNSLRLLASQTFGGQYNAEGINPADWVDITSAFTLSGIKGNDDYESSGTVDLKTLTSQGLDVDPDKLLFFAFKYTGTTGSTQPRWWINQFDLVTVTPDGQELPITNLQGGGWVSVALNNSPVPWVFNANGLRFQGGNNTVGSNLVYAVSRGFNLNAVNPDIGVSVKGMATRMEDYTYKFEKAGTYRVVFVGANHTVYGLSQVIKEFTIVVEP